MRRSLIIPAAWLVVFIFLINLVAYKFYWYSSIWWFDMLMHTLGGVFLAFATGAIGSSYLSRISARKVVHIVLLSVFVIGVGWEVFEYAVQYLIKSVQLASIDDSISDLLCDMAGGYIGVFFVLAAKRRYNKVQ